MHQNSKVISTMTLAFMHWEFAFLHKSITAKFFKRKIYLLCWNPNHSDFILHFKAAFIQFYHILSYLTFFHANYPPYTYALFLCLLHACFILVVYWFIIFMFSEIFSCTFDCTFMHAVNLKELAISIFQEILFVINSNIYSY